MGGHNKCTSACNGGGRVRFLLNSYYLNDLILRINCIDKKILQFWHIDEAHSLLNQFKPSMLQRSFIYAFVICTNAKIILNCLFFYL